MKRGRKPANGYESKTELLTVRMSGSEYQRLACAAKNKHLTMSDIVYIALDEYYMTYEPEAEED